MNKKNGAIIGFGGMGQWHSSFISNSDVVNLSGIYDIDPEKVKLAQERGFHTFNSLEEILNDPSIDFITIAVPNDLHKPFAVQALNAGKNVISEKPVTLSSTDLQEMFDAAKKNNKIFTTHQNRRWDGEFLVMRDVYNSGDLGDVFCMETRVLGSRGIPGDWRQEKVHGGGMMLDWGVHLIDQIMGIVTDKKPLSVWCKCEHITNCEVDDGFKLQLYFEDDLSVLVQVGTSHFITLPRFYMTGSNGSAIIPDWGQPCNIVYCHNWDEKDVVPVKTAAGITKTMAPRDDKTISSKSIPQPGADVHDFYRNFCLAVDGKAEQIVTHKQLMTVMKIMEAAFKSDATGMPVAIDD